MILKREGLLMVEYKNRILKIIKYEVLIKYYFIMIIIIVYCHSGGSEWIIGAC